MTDVNYLEYGRNLQRVELTAESGATFLGDNGYYLGILIAIAIILLAIAGIFLIGLWIFKNAGKKLIK